MTPEPRPDPFELVGTTIAGKYDVEQIVAQTALSVVYRATHRVWQRSVAIKAFTAPSLSDEARQQLLTSFVDEGRMLMDLSERCASICQARDVSSLTTARGDWVPYTVLEWLDGECLEVLLRRERAEGRHHRTLAGAVDLLNPIAEALAIAHEQGIVHRDVKPGNIFVLNCGEGEARRSKLLDFGVAKMMHGVSPAAAGAIVTQSFTPSYGAPEQFSAAYGTTGPWTDVFALGLIVVELLTGREALRGDDVGALAAQSCDPNLRPTARALGAAVSDEVELVLARALAVRFEDRFANARELWSALCDALAVQPLEGSAMPDHASIGDVPVSLPAEAMASPPLEAAALESPAREVPDGALATPAAGHEDRGAREGERQGDPGFADVDSLMRADVTEPLSATIPIALNRRRVSDVAPHIPHVSEETT
jgi:serine/threonine protein kinase